MVSKQAIMDLQSEIKHHTNLITVAQSKLNQIQLGCNHYWGEPTYTPIIHEGYQDPGGPEGTMGIDRRLPFYVEREEIKQWTRICKICNKVEVTQRVSEVKREIPKFS